MLESTIVDGKNKFRVMFSALYKEEGGKEQKIKMANLDWRNNLIHTFNM